MQLPPFLLTNALLAGRARQGKGFVVRPVGVQHRSALEGIAEQITVRASKLATRQSNRKPWIEGFKVFSHLRMIKAKLEQIPSSV